MKKILPIVACCLSVCASHVLGDTFKCEVKQYGYNSALTGAAGNTARKLEIVKSWIGASFTVDNFGLTFKNRKTLKITGGDGITSFQAVFTDGKYNVNYNVKLNIRNNSAVVYMKQPNFKSLGPVRYTCQNTVQNSQRSSTNNVMKNSFDRLNTCNKKYVQQFMTGLGFYSGRIDGQWGPNTANGLNKTKSLPSFKNMSTQQFFEKLKQNPLC